MISFDERNLYLPDFISEMKKIYKNNEIKRKEWNKEKVENYIKLLKLGYNDGQIIINIDDDGSRSVIYGEKIYTVIPYLNFYLSDLEKKNIVVKFYELRGTRVEKINFLELYNNINEEGNTYEDLLEMIYGNYKNFNLLKKIFFLLKRIVPDIKMLDLLELYLNYDNIQFEQKFSSKKDKILDFMESNIVQPYNIFLNNCIRNTLIIINRKIDNYYYYNDYYSLENEIESLEKMIINVQNLDFLQCSFESFEKDFVDEIKFNEMLMRK